MQLLVRNLVRLLLFFIFHLGMTFVDWFVFSRPGPVDLALGLLLWDRNLTMHFTHYHFQPRPRGSKKKENYAQGLGHLQKNSIYQNSQLKISFWRRKCNFSARMYRVRQQKLTLLFYETHETKWHLFYNVMWKYIKCLYF